MARVTAIFRPGDFPSERQDPKARQQLADLFGTLFPGVADPAFDEHHAGMAIAAQSPGLALMLARASGFIAGELPWSQRKDLRELAIQTVNHHFASHYSYRSRIAIGESVGITAEMQDALPNWKASGLFDDEQGLVIDYAKAVATGSVPQPLFDRVVTTFGEQGAVECTAVAAFWAFWALFLNATHPQ